MSVQGHHRTRDGCAAPERLSRRCWRARSRGHSRRGSVYAPRCCDQVRSPTGGGGGSTILRDGGEDALRSLRWRYGIGRGQRRNHRLGEMPVPLGPCCLLAVGEIERVHDVSALPAVVRRRFPPRQRRRSGTGVLEPAAAGRDRCRRARYPQLAPWSSRLAISFATDR